MLQPTRILITGASGFLGRHLVRLLCRRHHVIAIDRRPRADAEEAGDPKVEWHQIDLSDADALGETVARVRAGGPVGVAIHLAAYYDFTGLEHPEYQQTNVVATRYLLDACRTLGLRRFVFASSVAACPFSSPGKPITEATPPDGDHVYARSKKAGEEMLAGYMDDFPSVTVRFAAMFSDWCEYPPLQVFLETWLSERWNSRILGGRGESAIPYLHIRDATVFMHHLLARIDELGDEEVVVASVDGAVSHADLFAAATATCFGSSRRALHVPRPLCRPGMWARDVVGRLLGSRPFERPWMAAYIDRKMEVDAAVTRRLVGWNPNPRLALLNRLPFLIENLKTSPVEWQRRNQEALEHLALQPSFRVYRLLMKHQREIDAALAASLTRWARATSAADRSGVDLEEWLWDARSALRTLVDAVRSGDKQAFRAYCYDLARRRTGQDVAADDLVHVLRTVEATSLEVLRRDDEAAALESALHDWVRMTVEYGIDRILEAYEEAAVFGAS